jgi:hypothetical protein
MSTTKERVKKHRKAKKDLGFKIISFQISAKDFKELLKFKTRNDLTYSEAIHELLINLKNNKPRRGK